MDIYAKIVEIVALVFRLDSEQVRRMSADDSLATIGLDSLNCMEIVVNIEEEFSVAFHDEELLLDNLNTINKLCVMVSKKLELYTI
ncbi:acyl carrier protein [Cohnella panacarvi]|uniref:acyl carrier protein n=1 Tax=Cohnella panacarvi TaxID=400776 RepID=UPI00047E6199|nr:acyl carrier protein [Cohnella panacarvi]